jgi:hypothetical protein
MVQDRFMTIALEFDRTTIGQACRSDMLALSM